MYNISKKLAHYFTITIFLCYSTQGFSETNNYNLDSSQYETIDINSNGSVSNISSEADASYSDSSVAFTAIALLTVPTILNERNGDCEYSCDSNDGQLLVVLFLGALGLYMANANSTDSDAANEDKTEFTKRGKVRNSSTLLSYNILSNHQEATIGVNYVIKF